ncbi:MAG TPA: hypothetical protein VIY48_00725 [Candidatus Paceibacterota bacterium]
MRVLLLLFALFPGLAFAADDLKQQIYPCALDNAARKIEFDKGVLFICYFGNNPTTKTDGWISVAGVAFFRLPPNAKVKPEFLMQADEFGFNVDYRFLNDRLEITSYFDAYPDFDAVPFFVETINVNQIPAKHERRLIYKPAHISKEEMVKALAFLKIDERKYRKLYQFKYGATKLYEQMFILRDYAFIDPLSMGRELKKMENYWWQDGEVAEVFDSIQHDVLQISEIRSENLN